MMNLSMEQYEAMTALDEKLRGRIEAALAAGEGAAGEAGTEVARMHREWLGYSWPKYSAEAHRGLAQMYVDDERFTAYYDGNRPGCAAFLRDAIHTHIK